MLQLIDIYIFCAGSLGLLCRNYQVQEPIIHLITREPEEDHPLIQLHTVFSGHPLDSDQQKFSKGQDLDIKD